MLNNDFLNGYARKTEYLEMTETITFMCGTLSI